MRHAPIAMLLSRRHLPSSRHAQTIYPIDRAEILVGRALRLQGRVSGSWYRPTEVKVTVNGADYAAVFGKSAAFIEREDGKDQSALVLRDVTLTKPGAYEVQVTDGAQRPAR